ncbi:MAG: acyl-CoA dehydrogenase family protein, partial [Gammaproteobacteria bacterium]
MSDLAEFREEVRDWLKDNCPEGARGPVDFTAAPEEPSQDMQLWRERMIERGWTVSTWPKEYGGGGLSRAEARVLAEEMARINARPPVMGGMGTSMLGPTLLEFGTEEQKKRHLIPITRGETRWCQGYSEPGAGSDLASLKTRAEDKGDHFVINGQKIWTSGAQYANRMFALVRTDPDAPKHEGISFV